MEKTKATQEYTSKSKVLGIILTLFCDFAFLTTCTLVKLYNLRSAEVCFVRGLLQISVFIIVYIILNYCRKLSSTECENREEALNPTNHRPNKKFDFKLTVLIILCGISFGAMTLLSYISVKLIPLSHFVVFGHTAPVFTLVLSALILR